MEAAGDTFLENTILWLAQTILTNLLLDKLDEWLRRVGLADDTEKLKSEIEEAYALVASVKGRAAGNRLLARSLAHLKELLYCMTVTTWLTSSTTAGSSTRSKEFRLPVLMTSKAQMEMQQSKLMDRETTLT